MEDIEKIYNCRICGDEVNTETVIDFGESALHNSYLSLRDVNNIKDGLVQEFKSNLSYFCCKTCGCFQIHEAINPDILFKNYLYASSTSNSLVKYFKKYCDDIIERFKLQDKGKLVYVGASNDGVELKNFCEKGIRSIGIEPATNLAELANNNGYYTENEFLNKETAQRMAVKYGKADFLMINNCLAHTNNPHEIFNGIKILLKDTGCFVFENSYAGAMVEKNLFDILYFEHYLEYSCKVLYNFLDAIGLEMFDWQNTEPHGGSFRCFAQFKGGPNKIEENVQKQLDYEISIGLNDYKNYLKWSKNLDKNRNKLKEFIDKEKALGKSFCGYTYPAKATTLCNFYGIGDVFDYIVEDSAFKIGLYTPQFHVEIKNKDYFNINPTDYCIVLAWNVFDVIKKNNSQYKGIWINPLDFNE